MESRATFSRVSPSSSWCITIGHRAKIQFTQECKKCEKMIPARTYARYTSRQRSSSLTKKVYCARCVGVLLSRYTFVRLTGQPLTEVEARWKQKFDSELL